MCWFPVHLCSLMFCPGLTRMLRGAPGCCCDGGGGGDCDGVVSFVVLAESRNTRRVRDESIESQRRSQASISINNRSPSPLNNGNNTSITSPYERRSSVTPRRQSNSSSSGLLGLSNLGNTVRDTEFTNHGTINPNLMSCYFFSASWILLSNA